MRNLTITEFYRLRFSFRPYSDTSLSSLIELVYPVERKNKKDKKADLETVAVLPPTATFSEILEVATDVFRTWVKDGVEGWKEFAEELGLVGEVV